MFISVLELFKIGIGPSSSHTMGPMRAAREFTDRVAVWLKDHRVAGPCRIRCILKGSLAWTGKGHATDRAITLGLHGIAPEEAARRDIEALVEQLWRDLPLPLDIQCEIRFSPIIDLVFDKGEPLPQHPNGMIFRLVDPKGVALLEHVCFSIGGGFLADLAEIQRLDAPLRSASPVGKTCPYGFASATEMLELARKHELSIAEMKRINEQACRGVDDLDQRLDGIWEAMAQCIRNGLAAEGVLPGGLGIRRRAAALHRRLLRNPEQTNPCDWLSAYAMAVNEENAAGHLVVTAPTNGAAGVIPAVLYHLVQHEGGSPGQVRDFLLTAAAIGGLIKHNSSISGAEVGCQGEVGAAAAMAAAGLCAVRGGTPPQVEKAAEMALEHHLGMTCDPVAGLVQVPCIERNAFGAVKAHAAASLARLETAEHFMPLDACIDAMRRTGEEMSDKYKETSLGGLAVSVTEC
ncbi:MAG: L-serine ammonia-lyase [Gammaproteobacteria bacterium]|nr:MAG: L-serine ammonia-lyase [Gammaproteobacteria bacterium]